MAHVYTHQKIRFHRFGPRTAARSVLVGGLLIAFTVQAFGLDVGGFLESETTFRRTAVDDNDDAQNQTSFANISRLFIRRNPEVSGPLTVRWNAQVSARSESTWVMGEEPAEPDWILDIDRLDLRVIAPNAVSQQSVFRGSLGRFAFTDTSGLILDDRVDGLSLSLDFPSVTASTTAGYTGLLTKENSTILVSQDDVLDTLDEDQAFAPPRIVTGLSFIFPEIAGRQSMSVEGLAQWDMREDYDAEKVDAQYLYLTGNGPLSEALYYDFAVAGTSVQRSPVDNGNEQEFGLAAQLRTQLFLDVGGRNLLTGLVRYGSGESGRLDDFTSIAPAQPDILTGIIPLADTTLFLLDYSFNPYADRSGAAARRIELSAYGSAAYTSRPAEEDAYRGSEFGGRITARPFSDFGAKFHAAGEYNNADDTFYPLAKLQFSARF